MALKSKPICLAMMSTMMASLLFCAFFALDFIHAYRLSKVGAQIFFLTSVASIPTSLVLAIVEWKRPQRALGWPLGLLALSALPGLFLMAVFWNDPD